MEFAKSTESITARKDLPNTEGQDAVVPKAGTTVAHAVPVRGAANKPTSTDRNSDASLCSAEVCSGSALNPRHHAKSGQGPGTESPAAAKPPCLLLLTQYRLIVTSNSGAASIVGATPFAGRPLTLPKLASIGSIASRGIARIAVLDGRALSAVICCETDILVSGSTVRTLAPQHSRMPRQVALINHR